MRRLDLKGHKFGRLTVSERAEKLNNRTAWICKCECGNIAVVNTDPLRAGKTKSCGCIAKELVTNLNLSHGQKRNRKASREYKSWQHAKSRCFVSSNRKYKIYGARGITMCDRWANSFMSFYEDMGPCPQGMTLDRIDVNGNYEPGNCRWATPKEQSRNIRKNVIVNFKGRPLTLVEFSEKIGANYKTVHRLYRYQKMNVDEIARRFS